MRTRTGALAVLAGLALAGPGLAQSSGTQPFSFTPSQFHTYNVVDTSKMVIPPQTGGAVSLGNFQSTPVNVTRGLQQSFNPLNMGGMDPTRSLQPRQPLSMFQVPNVFSRLSSLSVFPAVQSRRVTTQFPNPSPQKK